MSSSHNRGKRSVPFVKKPVPSPTSTSRMPQKGLLGSVAVLLLTMFALIWKFGPVHSAPAPPAGFVVGTPVAHTDLLPVAPALPQVPAVPMIAEDGQVKRADQIKEGDKIWHNGKWMIVRSIKQQTTTETKDTENYFVGENRLLVHNGGDCVPDIARTIRILENDQGVVHIVGNGPKGSIEVIAKMTREGNRLTLSGAHIDGPGAGNMGIREIGEFARQFGKQEGVEEVVIEGARRTTGARPGDVPRPFTFKVN